MVSAWSTPKHSNTIVLMLETFRGLYRKPTSYHRLEPMTQVVKLRFEKWKHYSPDHLATISHSNAYMWSWESERKGDKEGQANGVRGRAAGRDSRDMCAQ